MAGPPESLRLRHDLDEKETSTTVLRSPEPVRLRDVAARPAAEPTRTEEPARVKPRHVPPPPKDPEGFFEAFVRGHRSSMQTKLASDYAIEAREAELAGDIETRNQRLQRAQYHLQRAHAVGPEISSYKDVGSVDEAVRYALGLTGESAFSVATSIMGGVVGRTATGFARSVPAVSKPLKKYPRIRDRIDDAGTFVGATAPMYGQIKGGVILGQETDPIISQQPVQSRERAATLTALGSSALEGAVPAVIGARVGRRALARTKYTAKDLAGRVSGRGRLGRDMVAEGMTELAQSELEQFALHLQNPELSKFANSEEAINAFFGGLAGGAFGHGIGRGMEGVVDLGARFEAPPNSFGMFGYVTLKPKARILRDVLKRGDTVTAMNSIDKVNQELAAYGIFSPSGPNPETLAETFDHQFENQPFQKTFESFAGRRTEGPLNNQERADALNESILRNTSPEDRRLVFAIVDYYQAVEYVPTGGKAEGDTYQEARQNLINALAEKINPGTPQFKLAEEEVQQIEELYEYKQERFRQLIEHEFPTDPVSDIEKTIAGLGQVYDRDGNPIERTEQLEVIDPDNPMLFRQFSYDDYHFIFPSQWSEMDVAEGRLITPEFLTETDKDGNVIQVPNTEGIQVRQSPMAGFKGRRHSVIGRDESQVAGLPAYVPDLNKKEQKTDKFSFEIERLIRNLKESYYSNRYKLPKTDYKEGIEETNYDAIEDSFDHERVKIVPYSTFLDMADPANRYTQKHRYLQAAANMIRELEQRIESANNEQTQHYVIPLHQHKIRELKAAIQLELDNDSDQLLQKGTILDDQSRIESLKSLFDSKYVVGGILRQEIADDTQPGIRATQEDLFQMERGLEPIGKTDKERQKDREAKEAQKIFVLQRLSPAEAKLTGTSPYKMLKLNPTYVAKQAAKNYELQANNKKTPPIHQLISEGLASVMMMPETIGIVETDKENKPVTVPDEEVTGTAPIQNEDGTWTIPYGWVKTGNKETAPEFYNVKVTRELPSRPLNKYRTQWYSGGIDGAYNYFKSQRRNLEKDQTGVLTTFQKELIANLQEALDNNLGTEVASKATANQFLTHKAKKRGDSVFGQNIIEMVNELTAEINDLVDTIYEKMPLDAVASSLGELLAEIESQLYRQLELPVDNKKGYEGFQPTTGPTQYNLFSLTGFTENLAAKVQEKLRTPEIRSLQEQINILQAQIQEMEKEGMPDINPAMVTSRRQLAEMQNKLAGMEESSIPILSGQMDTQILREGARDPATGLARPELSPTQRVEQQIPDEQFAQRPEQEIARTMQIAAPELNALTERFSQINAAILELSQQQNDIQTRLKGDIKRDEEGNVIKDEDFETPSNIERDALKVRERILKSIGISLGSIYRGVDEKLMGATAEESRYIYENIDTGHDTNLQRVIERAEENKQAPRTKGSAYAPMEEIMPEKPIESYLLPPEPRLPRPDDARIDRLRDGIKKAIKLMHGYSWKKAGMVLSSAEEFLAARSYAFITDQKGARGVNVGNLDSVNANNSVYLVLNSLENTRVRKQIQTAARRHPIIVLSSQSKVSKQEFNDFMADQGYVTDIGWNNVYLSTTTEFKKQRVDESWASDIEAYFEQRRAYTKAFARRQAFEADWQFMRELSWRLNFWYNGPVRRNTQTAAKPFNLSEEERIRLKEIGYEVARGKNTDYVYFKPVPKETREEQEAKAKGKKSRKKRQKPEEVALKTFRDIEVALDLGSDFGSKGAREKLAGFFSEHGLTDHEQRMHKDLDRTAYKNKRVRRQVETLLSDDAVVERLKLTKDELDAIAAGNKPLYYAVVFQLATDPATQERINLSPTTEQWFKRLVEYFLGLLGIHMSHYFGEQIFSEIQAGRLTNRNDIHKFYRDMSTGPDKALAHISHETSRAIDKIYTAAPDVLRKLNTPMARDIAEEFDEFIPRRRQQNDYWLNKFQKEFLRGKFTEADLEKGWQEYRIGDPQSKAAKAIEAYINQIYDYMGRRKVKMANFNGNEWKTQGAKKRTWRVPAAWNIEELAQRRQDFEALLAKYGVEIQEATRLTDSILWANGHYSLVEYENGGSYDYDANPTTPGSMSGLFQVINKNNAAEFEPFMANDGIAALLKFTRQAVHKAEFTHSFGHNGKAIDQMLFDLKQRGLSRERLIYIEERIIPAMVGTLTYKMHPRWRAVQGVILTVQNMAILPLMIFPAMVDIWGISMTTGEMSDGWYAFKRAMREIRASITNEGPGAFEDVAELMGIITEQSLLDRVGDTYNEMLAENSLLRRWNQNFFKFTGIEQWTKGVRIAALQAGMKYIAAKRNDAKALSELGLEKKDVKVDKNGDLIIPKNPEFDDPIAAALNKFVDSTVLRPSAAHRPAWGSDPRWLLVWHLKQFTFTFHKVFLDKVIREMQKTNPNYYVLLPFLMMVPTMMVSDFVKNVFFPSMYYERMGFGELIMHAVARSSILGVGTFGLDTMKDIEFGKIPGSSLLGPTADSAYRFYDRGFGEGLFRLTPGYTIWNRWF